MQYWRGWMNWPCDPSWSCEVCGNKQLAWGLIHAQCRCDECHTEYRMRDKNQAVVTVPIWQIRPEYADAARQLWKELGIPIDEIGDADWARVMPHWEIVE